MEKFMIFMNCKIMPVASKIGQQRHLIAIRDGFLAIIALTMISSLSTLITNIPFEFLEEFLKNNTIGQQIAELCQNISWGAFSFMAIFSCIAIAQSLWSNYGHKGFDGGLVAGAVFLAVSKQTVIYKPEGTTDIIEVAGGLASKNFGATALFTGIIVALITIELLHCFSKLKCLEIKLPDMVPPAVSRSFKTMLPGMVTIIVAVTIGLILRNISGEYLADLIIKTIQYPIQSVTNSLGTAIIYPLIVCVLWSIGVHGTNVLDGITTPILSSLGAQNMQLAEQGATSGYNIINGPFFACFVWLGGAGVTLGLIIAMIIAGKKSRERYGAITSLSMGPGIFNINEPIIFGLPVVLNPIIIIPFIITPVILSVISYLAFSSGLVSPVIVQTVPWTTPAILSGFLATGHWSGALLSGFNLLLSVIIYIPFVKISISIEEKKEKDN